MSTEESRPSIEGTVVVVGDGSVGKTCLCEKYIKNEYVEGHDPTVFENYQKLFLVNDESVCMSISDTAGQDSYDRIRILCYSYATIFILCFAIDRPESLKNCETKWIPELNAYVSQKNRDLVFILVGLKSDLRIDEDFMKQVERGEKSLISKEEGQRVAERVGAYAYFEASARANQNVEDVFLCARDYIYNLKHVSSHSSCCSIV